MYQVIIYGLNSHFWVDCDTIEEKNNMIEFYKKYFENLTAIIVKHNDTPIEIYQYN